MAHQAVLIVRRKTSITTPLHASVQGAIEWLSRSDRHVTLRIGSTDIGIVFPLRDQKNTNLVRDSTQSLRLPCLSPCSPPLDLGRNTDISSGMEIPPHHMWCLVGLPAEHESITSVRSPHLPAPAPRLDWGFSLAD